MLCRRTTKRTRSLCRRNSREGGRPLWRCGAAKLSAGQSGSRAADGVVPGRLLSQCLLQHGRQLSGIRHPVADMCVILVRAQGAFSAWYRSRFQTRTGILQRPHPTGGLKGLNRLHARPGILAHGVKRSRLGEQVRRTMPRAAIHLRPKPVGTKTTNTSKQRGGRGQSAAEALN